MAPPCFLILNTFVYPIAMNAKPKRKRKYKSGKSCVVVGCSKRFDKNVDRSFFRLQNEQKYPELRELWLNAIRRKVFESDQNKDWHPKKEKEPHVCGDHYISGKRSSEENRQILMENRRLIEENNSLREEIKSVKFNADFLGELDSDNRPKFYTGVPTYGLFQFLIRFCASVLPHSKVLSPSCVMMVLLMKLRLNLKHQDLAYRFNISQSHVSDILNKGLPGVASKLVCFVRWPDQADVHRTLPSVFRKAYNKCRVIIDCTEVFIQRAKHLTGRANTWSNYKHFNTVKFLVGINPNGAVSFISKAFGGRVSDKVITQISGILDLIEHGDQVMADRGFLIADEVNFRNAELIIYDFTRGKTQLSAREVERSRKIAHVRIHVERAIGRLKQFNIISSVVSMSMVPHANRVMTIISAITNFHGKLVK